MAVFIRSTTYAPVNEPRTVPMRRWLAQALRDVAQRLDPEPPSDGFFLSGFYWDDEEEAWVLTNPALTLPGRPIG
jgi:hypothetical protein